MTLHNNKQLPVEKKRTKEQEVMWLYGSLKGCLAMAESNLQRINDITKVPFMNATINNMVFHISNDIETWKNKELEKK